MLSPDDRAGTRPSRAKAAESLIRSLVGVADARVGNGNGRIDNIRIVPRGDASPHQITRNVASAIMAHFGQSIDPADITVHSRMAETDTNGHDPEAEAGNAHSQNGRSPNGHAASNGAAEGSPNGSEKHDPMTRPHDVVSNGQRADAVRLQADVPATRAEAPVAAVSARPAEAANAARPAASLSQPAAPRPSTPAGRPNPTNPAPAFEARPFAVPGAESSARGAAVTAVAERPMAQEARAMGTSPRASAAGNPSAPAPSSNGGSHKPGPRVRLDSVEITNVERGLRCRVALSLSGETFTGVGDGPNRPADLTDLAARVTIDALRAARQPSQPMQLEGTATTVVGGQVHVVTAVSIWNGSDFDRVSGAQPVSGSPAEAAALSVIRSVAERLNSNA